MQHMPVKIRWNREIPSCEVVVLLWLSHVELTKKKCDPISAPPSIWVIEHTQIWICPPQNIKTNMWRFSSQNILILHIRMCWLKTSLKMSRVNKNGLYCGLNGEHTILWIPIMDDYDHNVVQPPVESSTTVRGADVLLGQKFNCFFQKGLAPSHQEDTWSTRSDQVPRKKYCKIHAAQIPMVYHQFLNCWKLFGA